MSGRTFRWIVPPSRAYHAQIYIRALDDTLGSLLDGVWAPIIEADAKTNASWTDRTSNARQTLAAFAYKRTPTLWALVLRHWMTYGKWLELRWGGRYAIILPTLQLYYQPIWDSIVKAAR